MPDRKKIRPTGPLHATIRPPGSKSITNRALVCAALAEGTSVLAGALTSEDTQVMVDGLGRLGVDVQADQTAQTIRIDGCGGRFPKSEAELFVANSGTTVRFLTAAAALGHGAYRLDGTDRMRQRPIGDLLEALNQLGTDAQSQADNGCPPVSIRADGLRGGTATIRGNLSSQYLSGLLMVAPYAEDDVELVVDGPLVSQPYIRITLGVMKAFGIDVPGGDLTRFAIRAPQRYRACCYAIEPDASAASYFWAAAAITGGRITVEGLSRDALQGDVAFCRCLEQMGCRAEYADQDITITGTDRLRGIEVNMNEISDTVQTLSAVALFADGPTTITGVAHNRLKESDRIGDLARELRKLGATVDERPDGMRITPGPLHATEIETYNDHRMAMSLALVGLRVAGVVILDPDCTGKTYPDFWRDLESLG